MWSINYEDVNKLHMSIGIGLVLGGYILILSNIWSSSNLLIQYAQINSSDKVEIERALISCFTAIEKSQYLGVILIFLGSILFLVGYFNFIKKEQLKDKENNKTPKDKRKRAIRKK